MDERFEIRETSLTGLKLIQRKPVGDHRGYLERLFCSEDFSQMLPQKIVAQINRTQTRKRGTIRGMHYQQAPHSEAKFVSCLRGEVFDVAVDLRRGSATFLHWHAEVLSDENHRTLFIPAGFAHGLQTLSDDCELLYFHSAPYRPAAERGLSPEDPRLAIAWPEPIAELSNRDATAAFLTDQFGGIQV